MGERIKWDGDDTLGPDVAGDVLVVFRDGTTMIGPVEWFDWESYGDDNDDIVEYEVIDHEVTRTVEDIDNDY